MLKKQSKQGRRSALYRRGVKAWAGKLTLPTCLPAPPDRNPMFFEKRVYQGSSGRIYPLPFTDRMAEKPVDRDWDAVWIENEFLRVLVLPEIGGRIHTMLDKTNGYDVIYNQPVIKPALVGLAGPWISGGIEFNWPQHHRPATFLPVDTWIERHRDGSVTIWCSDHDPLQRMKGMHGICLHPGRALVELKVRACNRTALTQTFLWWANVAIRVHEACQSFFPPDVYYIVDHARRAVSEYPLARGFYYGVNFGQRGRQGVPQSEVPRQFIPPHCGGLHSRRRSSTGAPVCQYAPNDLSFYANIPTPCSYMCMGSKQDFFGGYDFAADAGIVHIANHHIAPGKKQWTWGNHEFGYAWDRNLTEPDARNEFGPYIEMMAGVYTDNQPDFSFLRPGETKTWSQFWYPIQRIGPAQHANLEAAVSLRVLDRTERSGQAPVRLGISVTRRWTGARILLTARDEAVFDMTTDLAPGLPFVKEILPVARLAEKDLQLRVLDSEGREIIVWRPGPSVKGEVPPPATEPPRPAEIASADELYITGLHLDQYRHATRCPTEYWREALRRDPLDSRCNNALGLWHLKRGEFIEAEKHFRRAIERLTRRNPNPEDGEPYYNLGLCLRYQLDAVGGGYGVLESWKTGRIARRTPLQLISDAYAALYKATWNQAWACPGYHALAEIDSARRDWPTALDHLNRSLRLNADNLRARNLKVVVLRRLGLDREAAALLSETLALDPLDWWARQLRGDTLDCDLQTALDLAHDYARAGLLEEAVATLKPIRAPRGDLPDQSWGALPMVHYTLGWLEQRRGDARSALKHFNEAAALAPDYCFPARVEDIAILQSAILANGRDARAPYYLGNLLYDRRRHREAIRMWEQSARLDPNFSIVWRNLGIGYFNVLGKAAKARAAYNRAFTANSNDARLLYERDQLWKRLRESPERRLREIEKWRDLVHKRDDLSIELCALYNQTGQHTKALTLVSSRKFQPWEGGEGGPLGQHVRSHVALGCEALASGRAERACEHFVAALQAPENLGEAKHLLANQSHIHYWLGCALANLGDKRQAREHWRAAATFQGDFQEMSVRAFSEMTYYSALSWEKLGRRARSTRLLRDLLAYGLQLQKTKAAIDYFATSLPTLLLFEDDLQLRQETTALFLQAQAHLGLGRRAKAAALLRKVLRNDPSHALAGDLYAHASQRPAGSQPHAGTAAHRARTTAGQHRLGPKRQRRQESETWQPNS